MKEQMLDFNGGCLRATDQGPGGELSSGCHVMKAHYVVYRTLAEGMMNGLIYLVGLIVVIMFILSFLGLR